MCQWPQRNKTLKLVSFGLVRFRRTSVRQEQLRCFGRRNRGRESAVSRWEFALPKRPPHSPEVAAHLSPATKKCDAGIQKLACPKVTNNCVLVETDVHLLAGRRPRPDNSVFHTPASASGGCPNVYVGGGIRNVRVNQDCSLRRQAEEVIAINPTNSDNLIVGQNDSRIGFNHCGYDFSFDGGKTWADQTPPFYQFINNDGGTFDACSDPTATFDSGGNAYVGGVLFEIFYADSAFLVAKSNAGIGGAFYHTRFH